MHAAPCEAYGFQFRHSTFLLYPYNDCHVKNVYPRSDPHVKHTRSSPQDLANLIRLAGRQLVGEDNIPADDEIPDLFH